jgi:pyruvate ferredoxin oxidoreductase gamma subunit
MIEIVFHGRGGHGAVIAAELLARAAYNEGKHSQAFPFFGGERRGAPVRSFARIDDKPIMLHSQIYTADAMVVLDKELLEIARENINVNIVKPGGLILINESDEGEVRSAAAAEIGKAKVAYVDATGIARSLGLVVAGWPVINTAMLGALAKVSGMVSIESIVKAIGSYWTGGIAEKNIKAAQSGYDECKSI